MGKVKKLNRGPIKATEIHPWPSTWVLQDIQSGKYVRTVEGGQSLKTSWCDRAEDALELEGNDAMYLAPLIGDCDSPVRIEQRPEDD